MNKETLIKLRCKAWGITEDEYYCNQCSDFSLEDMARAYRRGKNKGARDKAIQNVGFYQKQMEDIYDKKNKQIAELEKENADLEDKLANVDYQLEGRDLEIKDLEKENAELNDFIMQSKKDGISPINALIIKNLGNQLTKAKELIKKFSEFVNNGIEYDPEHPQEHTDLWNKLCAEAEQFLNCSEKPNN